MQKHEHIHRTTVRVRYGDTDAAAVVYNANYLRYFEIGRTELMREWVCSYNEIEKMGFILPVVECWSRFKSPAFYDDLLTIETTITEVSKLKIKFSYQIRREEETSARSKLLVKGYTVLAATTREGKLTKLPEAISKKIAHFACNTAKVDNSLK